jgi:hypothetical protein
LKVFNLDYNNDRPQTGGDGFLILQGITIDSQNGRLIFTTKNHLRNYYFLNYQYTGSGENYDASTYNANQKVCF